LYREDTPFEIAMRKRISLLFCLGAVSLFGQIDQLKKGSSIDDIRKIFPKMEPDYASMTSYVSGETKLTGQEGSVHYHIERDTVTYYHFSANPAEGPSKRFPTVDSAQVMKLISVASDLIGHYTDVLGTPSESHRSSLLNEKENQNYLEPIYAQWNQPDNKLEIRVYRTVYHTPKKDDHPQINAAPDFASNMKSELYYMVVTATGRGLRLRSEMGLGLTGEQFKKWQPDLANQVQSFPDCWRASGASAEGQENWRFQFEQNKLIGFFYDWNDASSEQNNEEMMYAVFLKKANQLRDEAIKVYGQPYKDSSVVSTKYKRPKSLYYSRVDYLCQWKTGTDFLMIRMNERSGGKSPGSWFHLEVYFGRRD
jgi:hypothetical protein